SIVITKASTFPSKAGQPPPTLNSVPADAPLWIPAFGQLANTWDQVQGAEIGHKVLPGAPLAHHLPARVSQVCQAPGVMVAPLLYGSYTSRPCQDALASVRS